jgi:hypothetical protein
MDRMRGVFLPLLLVAMAGLMGFLGNVSTQDGRMLAARSQQIGARPQAGGVAPRAEADARRRAMLKHAHEASSEGMTLFGCSGLLLAGAALLFIFHLRFFRGAPDSMMLAGLGNGPDAGGSPRPS